MAASSYRKLQLKRAVLKVEVSNRGGPEADGKPLVRANRRSSATRRARVLDDGTAAPEGTAGNRAHCAAERHCREGYYKPGLRPGQNGLDNPESVRRRGQPSDGGGGEKRASEEEAQIPGRRIERT